MIENPLKKVLVKRAGFFDLLSRAPIGSGVTLSPTIERDFYTGPSLKEKLQAKLNPAKSPSFRDGAEFIEYFTKSPDNIRYFNDLQDLLGKDIKAQDVLKSEKALTDFARNRIYHRYGLQNASADQISRLSQNDVATIEQEIQRYIERIKNTLPQSARLKLEEIYKNPQAPTQTAAVAKETAPVGNSVINTSAPASTGSSVALDNADPSTPAQNPLANIVSDNLNGGEAQDSYALDPNALDSQFDPSKAIGDALDPRSGSQIITIPDLGANAAPAQPAPAQKPTGLTREETMQFLEQGYVPTSNGGFMLHEQRAADTLRAMQQNPNLNPGAAITNADRLNRIRTNILGNEQHTAQGRQLEADIAALNKYEYHQKHMAQQNANTNAQVSNYGTDAYRDIHEEIMRKGQNQAMRRVGGGEAYAGEAADRQSLGLPASAPLTPEEQYYHAYIKAKDEGSALPELPKAYNQQYNQQLEQYKGQLRQPSPAQTSVSSKNPNYMTSQEMNNYAASQSGKIAENTWKSLSPDRQTAARQALAARQTAYRNGVPQQPTAPAAKPAATPAVVKPAPVTKQPAATGAPASPTTTTSLKKTASIRKPLVNPFLK